MYLDRKLECRLSWMSYSASSLRVSHVTVSNPSRVIGYADLRVQLSTMPSKPAKLVKTPSKDIRAFFGNSQASGDTSQPSRQTVSLDLFLRSKIQSIICSPRGRFRRDRVRWTRLKSVRLVSSLHNHAQ